MMRQGIASDKERKLGQNPRDETMSGKWKEDAPVSNSNLMERILQRENLCAALHQVEENTFIHILW